MVRPRSCFTLSLLTAAAISAACSSPAAPTPLSASIVTSNGTDQAFSATVSGRTVTIAGSITTPDPCRDFSASAQSTDDAVDVTVTANVKPNATCVATLGKFNYIVTLPDVPTGSRPLNVKHHIDDQATSTVYSTMIDVR